MIEGAPFSTIAFSTSSADLARSHAERKVLIGPERLIGVVSSRPDALKHLQSVVGHELFDLFNNTELAFIMCGLGGLTGSLGARLLCSIARTKGATAIVLAATPFSVESSRRRDLASAAMGELRRSSTLAVEFDNDKLSALAPNLPLSRAFKLLNGIMMRPVLDLCAALSRDDIALLRQVLGSSTYGRFGLGMARGDERVQRAVDEALSSPWFDKGFDTVKAALAVYSAADPWDREAEKLLDALDARLPGVRIGWGSYRDPSLGERIRLSLLLCTGE